MERWDDEKEYEKWKAERPQPSSQTSSKPSKKDSKPFAISDYLDDIVVLGTILLIIFGLYYCESQPYRPSDMGAYIICKDFVKDRLKAPSTADFVSFGKSNVWKRTGDRFEVSSAVDSQNSFGANIRTHYTCEVAYKHSTNRWTLERLSINK